LPSYTLSKFAGTLFFQYLAQEVASDEVQIVSFHPGLIFNEYWEAMGVNKEHFDDGE
jgi:NAD(P)-dependent dehydrogenase (short-subunit alcohol dehydrogenase family)